MTMKQRPKLNTWDTIIATWFGAGYLPKAPGTWGSLAALPFAWIIHDYTGLIGVLIAAVLLFPVGVIASARFADRIGNSDPGVVVVDEIVGQWFALLPMLTFGWVGYICAFAAFRLFDILKPWPVGYLDRKLKGGLGIMTDDAAAGLLAAVFLWGGAIVLV